MSQRKKTAHEPRVRSKVRPAVIALPETGEAMLAVPTITAALGITKSTWWRWIAEGRAPKGIKLGPGSTRWKLSEIRALINGSAAGTKDAKE